MSLADYRNDTIHALWTADDDAGQPRRVRPKWCKALKAVDWSRGEPVTVDELRAKRQEMEQVYKDLDVARKV